MSTQTYDPASNIIVVGGVVLEAVNSIEIDKKNDDETLYMDADGDQFTYVVNGDRQSILKVNIDENSNCIPSLDAAILDSKSTGIPFNILINNMNSGRKMIADQCKLMKQPSIKLDKDAPSLDYSFLAVFMLGENNDGSRF